MLVEREVNNNLLLYYNYSCDVVITGKRETSNKLV